MIVDTLSNASGYRGLGAGFDLAFDFLRSDKPATAEPGRYDLDGDRVYAMVQEYTTRSADDALWEAHRVYADVQFVVDGQEQMGYAPLDGLAEDKPYDAENDYALYRGPGAMVPLKKGMFAVLLPQDAHMPQISNGEPGPVRKVVVKVQVSE